MAAFAILAMFKNGVVKNGYFTIRLTVGEGGSSLDPDRKGLPAESDKAVWQTVPQQWGGGRLFDALPDFLL